LIIFSKTSEEYDVEMHVVRFLLGGETFFLGSFCHCHLVAGSVIEKKKNFFSLHSDWLWYRAAVSVGFLNNVVLMQGWWILVAQGSHLHGTKLNALSTQLAFKWRTTELCIRHHRPSAQNVPPFVWP
jgi:hypothetical protein